MAGAQALGTGIIKGVFDTTDFLTTGAGMFGSPPAEKDRSNFRQAVDAASASGSAQFGPGYDLTEGVGTLAVGLLGAGKIALIGKAGNAAVTTMRLTAAFEPHAQNFGNLVELIPGVKGPVTSFFASSPDDSTAVGYFKNAMTSLGFEAATIAVTSGSMALLKALSSGDKGAIEAAHADLAKTVAKQSQGAEPSTSSSPSSPLQGSASDLSPASPTPGNPGETQTAIEPASSGTSDGLKTSLSETQASNTSGPASSGSEPSATPGVETQVVSSPTAGAEAIGATIPPRFKPFTLDDESIERLITDNTSDTLALIKHGSWDAAVAAGHSFASEDHIPWQKLSGDASDGEAATSLDAFTARVRDATREQADKMKGGDVQTDAMNERSVNQRVNLWNQDPGALLGALQAAGKRAADLRATMDAGFAVAQRAMQDAWTLAARHAAGDYSEFGGDQAASAEALKQTAQVAATAFGSANSILSNAARTVRGAQAAFKLDPATIRAMQSLDPEALAQALIDTKGDPRAISALLRPGVISRMAEAGQFFMVNNLISSPLTQGVIAMSNTWQALARPAMRMAGAAVNGSYDTVGVAAQKMYGYMASSIPDAFRSAVDAFKMGDSIISPHDLATGAGGAPGATGLGQMIAQKQFVPMNNVGDILTNILTAGQKTLAFPSRFVQFHDEFVKQVVYRGKVSADAFVEGSMPTPEGRPGLTGDDLTRYVQNKLFDAFDQHGHATDTAALNEAKVATYQNDLNPTGTFGWRTAGAVIQSGAQNFPPAKLILPFIRTPVNLFRQGVQLTPGLNMAQKEFRDAIYGVANKEAQAQAIGQMGMGALLMGTAATLAYQGLVTGDAPSDPKLASEAMADGWRPNSIVIPHKDGTKTYVPFGRFDPIMMPMAMAANIVAVLKAPEIADQNKAIPMMQALSIGMMKQLTDKLYLQNFKNTIDAIQSPDQKFAKAAGAIAGNFVPYSSALHLVNTDPVLREANDFVSTALSKVPGFSQHFPARRDYGGDPITVHKGLWLDTPDSQTDAEVQRLALQQGSSIGAPSSKGKGGAEYRDITLAGDKDPAAKGMSAYDRYQELAGHPERMPGASSSQMNMKQALSKLFASPQYQRLPDGSPDEPGTKIAAATSLVAAYRKGAKAFVASDQNVRAAEYAETKRVATANGYASPNIPTAVNTTNSFLGRLGAMIGVRGLQSPTGVTPTTALPVGGQSH